MLIPLPRRTIGIALLALAAACASSSSGTSSFETAQLDLDSISVERGACYGKCDIYQLILRRDGRVTLRKQMAEMQRDVRVGQAQRLLEEARDAGVSTLPERIQSDTTLCPLAATDHSTVIITAYAGKKVNRVDHYTGCYADHALRVVPRLERLVTFERHIDALAEN